MTVSKELIDAVIDQLKKNFKEAAILFLVIAIYRMDIKADKREAKIDQIESAAAKERKEHLEFVGYYLNRVNTALDTSDARIQRVLWKR